MRSMTLAAAAVVWTLIFVPSGPTAAWAKKAAAPAQPSKEPAQAAPDSKVEAVLATLDETLSENRLLQDRLKKIQDANERMLRENASLRQQVREAQKRVADLGVVQRKRVDDLEKQIKGMELTADKIARLETEHGQNRADWQQQIARLETHNRKLRELLDTAILESERKEYVALIENSKNTAAESIRKLAESNRANEKMKNEMGSLYYTLGNVLFENSDYRNAAAKYEKALQLNARDSWSHYNLGVIYDFYMKNPDKALYHYREYLRFKSAVEEANEIRERVLDLEMAQKLAPAEPIGTRFYEFQQKT